MLSILVEHQGVVFSVRSASSMLPAAKRDEADVARAILEGTRCPGHDDATGTVHLAFDPLAVEVDDPCCAKLVAAVRTALGLER